MCGIAGFEARDASDTARAVALETALAQRGPDRRWRVQQGGLWLVQTRLAIIDLSDRVAYPIPNETSDVWLLFNGEIYNHRALRGELERAGHSFRTRCDAEVVVHGYEEWGLDVFARLNGMFALAIVDERIGEVVLTRDRLGIKPLVRTTGDRFAFASDVMTLISGGLSAAETDVSALRQFAVLGYVPPPSTGLTDVAHVTPGTAVRRRRDGRLSIERWARPTFGQPNGERGAGADELEGALRDSVERQLVADVPVGVFLSGGIDSSLVLSYAVELGARPQAFTISFRGFGDYDEARRATSIARAMGVAHQTEELDMGFSEAATLVQDAFDQPFADSSAIATLALARLARRDVTVALSGTGGDDLFAGYYRHRAHRLLVPLRAVPGSALRFLGRSGPAPGGERRSAIRLARSYAGRLASAAQHDPARQYVELLAPPLAESAVASLAFDVDRGQVLADLAEQHEFEASRPAGALRPIQRFDIATYLAGDLLTKEDRATMSVGLECRVPMLDEHLVGVAERTPDDQKISLWSGKRPLRALAGRRLPADVARGRKRGFAVPLGDLLAGRWRAEAQEWLHALQGGLVDGPRAARALADGTAGSRDVWLLTALAGWEARLKRERTEHRLPR